MTIVKSVQFRKNFKEILEKSREEDVFLDYYGELFRIQPLEKKEKKINPVIKKFKNRKRSSFADNPIFDEKNPTQEKQNIRDYLYGTKTQKGILEK